MKTKVSMPDTGRVRRKKRSLSGKAHAERDSSIDDDMMNPYCYKMDMMEPDMGICRNDAFKGFLKDTFALGYNKSV